MKTLTAIAGLTLLTSVSFAQSVKIDAYTKDALLTGLDDERHAEALYKSAIAEFGSRTPFTNLVVAEVQHQNTIVKLMKAYGVTVPANPYLGQTLTIPTIFSDACLEFAQFERLEAAKYKEMAAKVNVKNVATVFLQLAKVSELNHAVALEKAAANNCGGSGICDGTGPKGNGGKGKGKTSLDSTTIQCKGTGICDGTGPKGNGGKGKGKTSVQTCATPQCKGTGICDGTGPKGNGKGGGKKLCDGTGPHGKGQGRGQGKGQGRGCK